MNKKLKACVFGFMLAPLLFATTSCNGNGSKISVTYVDGETELKKVEIASGEKVENWTPTVEGKDFFGWFGDPTLKHEFDFTVAPTENTTVFGAFVGYEKDTRAWGIAGSGKSSVLAASNWGKKFDEVHYLKNESTSKKNIFTMEINLLEKDQFQFTAPSIVGSTISWGHQRGAGYFKEFAKNDVTYFKAAGGLGGDNYTSNIEVVKSGKYKFTLTTYPQADFQDGGKEAYKNRNYFDSIDFEYIGEFSEEIAEYETIFYLKGEKITGWGDYQNDYTTMVTTDGVAKLENVYLKASDQFMFASIEKNTKTDEISTGNTYIKASNLTDTAKALVEGTENMKVKEDGYYTFEYNVENKTLEVTKTDFTPKAGEYYIDGSFCSWKGAGNDDYKMTQDTTDTDLWKSIELTLKENDELGIQYYDKSVENGYNGFFSSKLLISNDAFDTSNTNIKCKTAGKYIVTFNSYSHLITIEAVTE